MAITSVDGWFAAAKQKLTLIKTTSVTTTARDPFSLWDVAGNPSAGTATVGNTSSGILFTDATTGAPTINAFGGGATGYLAAAKFRGSVTGGMILYDRIWGAGAISLTSLATTNFSTQPSIAARLPATDYETVEILLEITTTVSATATTVSVTYTNEFGTTNRTTGATSSLSGITARRIIALPLQAGDSGVQKIESVTVGGTVATAGAFNVLIARRLAQFDNRVQGALDTQGWDVLGAPEIFGDSCLWLVSLADSTSSGTPTLMLDIING